MKRLVLIGLLMLFGLGIAAVIGPRLPPAYDFYGVYYPALRDVWLGRFSYAASPGFLNPPWTLVFSLPLGLPDVAVARAGLLLAMFVALAWGLLGTRRLIPAYTLIVVSTSMLAVGWLGQIEVFSLVGAWLGYRAVVQRRAAWLAIALLLLLIKPQETWLIIVWLLIISARHWRRRDWAVIVGGVAGVAALTSVWLGGEWIQRWLAGPERYSAQWQNFSLWHLLAGEPPLVVGGVLIGLAGATLFIFHRARLSRWGLGAAAVASNLLSPYLTSPHLLMTLCFGWEAVFERSPRWGLVIYLTSLTPLLRLVNADQAWNKLDVLFPLVVFGALMVGVLPKRERQS